MAGFESAWLGRWAFWCWVLGIGLTSPGARGAAPRASMGSSELERVQQRLVEYDSLLQGVGFAVCHCADTNEVRQLEPVLKLFQALSPSEKPSPAEAEQALPELRRRMVQCLQSRDPVIRGFAALTLGILGDTNHRGDIARLLADKKEAPTNTLDRLLLNFDRSRAAMALGLLGAQEYAPRLKDLLGGPDQADRAGAALGLGYLGAKDQAASVARLLSDPEDQVRAAAVHSLALLNATAFAKDIAALLTRLGDPSVGETAGYALVRLKARDQAGAVAELLRQPFKERCAAKVLALLGAQEYSPAIAELLDHDQPLVRADAAIALGILGAKEHGDRLAARLEDSVSFVRPYAAIALLLLGDPERVRKLSERPPSGWAPRPSGPGPDTVDYFKSCLNFHPLVAQEQRELIARASNTWYRVARTASPFSPPPARGLPGNAPPGAQTKPAPAQPK